MKTLICNLQSKKRVELEKCYSSMLNLIGEDTNREGLVKTPQRAAKAIQYLVSGYSLALKEVVGDAIFNENTDDMVIVKNIEVYSLCEHHLLPFFGKVSVGYLPNKRIIGIGKIPRIVDMFGRRLQVQERLTIEIAKAIEEILEPRGVGVVLEATHMCMIMRGCEKHESSTTTSTMLGEFRENQKTRQEFLSLLQKNTTH